MSHVVRCERRLSSCLASNMVFFFKQKTAYDMRISDWSSDVCSSDLPQGSCKTSCVALRRSTIISTVRSKLAPVRSEELRVGKECASRFNSGGSPNNNNKISLIS